MSITPILGAMKHTNIAPSFTPEPNLFRAMAHVRETVTRFEALASDWNSSSGKVTSQNGGYLYNSQIKVGRSPKTGKVLLSESRGQQRTGHQMLESSGIKAELITAFLDLETAILSLPVFSNPKYQLRFQSWSQGRGMYFLQDISLCPFGRSSDLLSRLTLAMEKIGHIKTNEDAPLWIVGQRVIPANTAEDAFLIFWALSALKENDMKNVEKRMSKPPKALVGKLEDMSRIHETCTSLMT